MHNYMIWFLVYWIRIDKYKLRDNSRSTLLLLVTIVDNILAYYTQRNSTRGFERKGSKISLIIYENIFKWEFER